MDNREEQHKQHKQHKQHEQHEQQEQHEQHEQQEQREQHELSADFDEEGTEKRKRVALTVAKGVGIAALAAGGFFLFGFLFRELWNALMPEIFGLKQITFWQGWGLVLLSFILFKGGSASESSGHSDRKRKQQLRKYMNKQADEAQSAD